MFIVDNWSKVIVSGFVLSMSFSAVTQAQGEQVTDVLEEVIVTATKIGPTDLQKTPISITAISSDELELSGISNLKDISLLAPGITINQNNSYGQLYIRGIGTNNVFTGGDPSSTIHLDGVYLSRPFTVFSEFLELERVEILRGPQGTLYGRNSTGGTINLITQKPSQAFSAKGILELGNYGKQRVTGVINGALGSDQLSGNLAFSVSKRDGYVDNQNASGKSELNDEDRRSVRTALRFSPADTLTIDVAADYFERDELPPQYKPTGEEAEGKPPAIATQRIDDFWTVNIPTVPKLDEQGKGVNVTIAWQLSANSQLLSITGYREHESEVFIDTDYSELSLLTIQSDEVQDQISQEIQYHYQNDSLSLVSGLYFYDETDEALTSITLLLIPVNPSPRNIVGSEVDTTASAIYADLGWQLNEQIELMVGGRYSREEKKYQGSLNNEAAPPARTVDDKESWTDFSPKLGVTYTPFDSILYYGTITQGFKSGGFNFTDGKDFEPEDITAYEVGIKSEFPAQRIRLNGSLFFYDYTDLQVLSFVAAGEAIETTNASDAEVKGIELELLANITDYWRVSAALTHLSTEYKDYTAKRAAALPNIDVSGNAFNSAPENTVSLVTDFRQPIANGSLLYRLEYYWQDKIYFTAFNDKLTSQDAYGLVNANISFNSADDVWQLQLYGKNLTDKEYSNSGLDFPPTGVALNINPPRTFGVKGTYYFK